MTQKIKRKVYLISSTVLGLLLGVLAESIIELGYIKLLISDFNQYSFGMSVPQLMQLRGFFVILVLAACGLWGYRTGKHWWHQIYELKRFAHKSWFKF